jgi:hypothetical protein
MEGFQTRIGEWMLEFYKVNEGKQFYMSWPLK